MKQSNWVFYDFYQRLRMEVGLQLDFRQYLMFLELFLQRTVPVEEDKNAKADLYQMLSTLWLSKPKFEEAFRRLFEEAYEGLTDFSSLKSSTIPKKSDPNRTSPPPSSEKLPSQTPSVPDQPPEELPTPESPQKNNYKDIFLQFSESSGKSYSGENQPHEDTSTDHPFIFSKDKFLPLSSRRAQRIWQRFRVYPTRKFLDEIDLEETIQYRARNKVIDQPIFKSIWENKRRLAVFIDTNSAMTPFEAWWELFLEAFKASNKACIIEKYFFTNAPQKKAWDDTKSSFIFYKNQARTESVNFHKCIKNWHRKHTAVMIFSNADINGKGLSEQRFQDSLEWLRLLRVQFKHLVWANPYPQERWNSKLAAYGSLIVPMVEMNEEGLREAVRIL